MHTHVTNGISMIKSSSRSLGKLNEVYPTLLWDKDHVILVDSGLGGEEDLLNLKAQITEAGTVFHKLSEIIITHQDLDHIGGLPGILKKLNGEAEVIAHEEEKPYIQGEKRLLKFTDEVVKSIEFWPENMRNKMKAVLENPPKAKVDRLVEDGEELPFCGGIIVIHTPGHTLGHICLYHKNSRTLISGDALQVEAGGLKGPDPKLAYNPKEAIESLKKLLQYDIEQVICYHGGLFKGNVKKRIEEIIHSSL